jgi:3',5'-cyclic AMP phosphodiesterase CpdA
VRTIAHLSDLHFGRVDLAAVAHLHADLAKRHPSLLIVSGDLTQRARHRQFLAAHNFLRQLPQPQLVVPGNHDIPFFDVIRRFLNPLGRYHRMVGQADEPLFQDDEMVVLGLNTARSLAWKSGRISTAQLQRLSSVFGSESENRFKILVTHHPFIPSPRSANGTSESIHGGKRVFDSIQRLGIDLLLSGHLHTSFSGDARTAFPTMARSLVVAQAGTAVSNRLRNEANGYNWIELSNDRILVSIRELTDQGFVEAERQTYRRDAGDWRSFGPDDFDSVIRSRRG